MLEFSSVSELILILEPYGQLEQLQIQNGNSKTYRNQVKMK